MPKNKHNANQQKNPKKINDPAIIAAIIAGVFAIVTTVMTVAPNWIQLFDQSYTKSENNALSYIPLYTDPLPATEAAPSIMIQNLQVFGIDAYFNSPETPSLISGLPREKRTSSTTDRIAILFDITSTEKLQWVKLENTILLKVVSYTKLSDQENQNVLPGIGEPGGLGSNINFESNFSGPLRTNDIIAIPPLEGADFFTLEPGELLVFYIDSSWQVPIGSYGITPGMIYTINGERRVIWALNSFSIISPNNPIYWNYINGQWVATEP